MTILRIQALESLGFEWDCLGAAWEDRLSELADYRKIHGHCNVPVRYSENSKLGEWVANQKNNHRLHLEGKISPMTTFRIQELESLDFVWSSHAWEDRLSELSDYRKINGQCNVPRYSENSKLAAWVAHQRHQYTLYRDGNNSHLTALRIQALESFGFEWYCHGAAWEGRLSELADYRKIHGHCNVPRKYSENIQLGQWVKKQKSNYRLHLEGKKSLMTLSRI
jgi:hypothetical protein